MLPVTLARPGSSTLPAIGLVEVELLAQSQGVEPGELERLLRWMAAEGFIRREADGGLTLLNPDGSLYATFDDGPLGPQQAHARRPG